MGPIFRFEFFRIFASWRNLILLALIVSTSFYFVNSGINEYRRLQEDKRSFQKYEIEKVKQYVNYKQYGGYGYRVFMEPSPLIIFLNNSNVLFDIEANVDTLEVIKIYSPSKGKKLFYSRGYFKDFVGFLFMVGSLLMVFMGVNAFGSRELLAFQQKFTSAKKFYFFHLLARLFYLNLFFILVFSLAHAWVRLRGIQFSGYDSRHYLLLGVYLVLVLVFFYCLGSLLTLLLKFSRLTHLIMLIVWFASLFLIPELNRVFLFDQSKVLPSNEEENIKTLKLLMEFEGKAADLLSTLENDETDVDVSKQYTELINDFLENVHLFNRDRETQLSNRMAELVEMYENRAVIFPTLFFNSLCGEVSSKGYASYLRFKEYILQSQEKFLNFYFQKLYIEEAEDIQSFVKENENIFTARSQLPHTFWLGLVITFLYISLFVYVGFIQMNRLLEAE